MLKVALAIAARYHTCAILFVEELARTPGFHIFSIDHFLDRNSWAAWAMADEL